MVSQASEAAQAAHEQMRERALAIEARAANGAPDLRVVDDDFEYEGDPAELSEVQRAVAARYGQVPAEGRGADDFDADADEVDLVVDDTPRVVNLTLASRESLRLEIPPLTVEQLDRMEWYTHRYNNKTQEMLKAQNPEAADRFGQQRRKIQEDMVLHMVPDMPRGLLGKLPAKIWNRLWRVIQSASAEAVRAGEANAEASGDPNS